MAVNYISSNTVIRTRQLLMFREWVPLRVRFWLYIAFGFLYQYVGNIYSASINEIVSEISLLNEDVQMAGYCTLGGITVCFPIMYRLRFFLYTRQLFFISGLALIACNVITMSVAVPWVIWGVSFIAGFFKMLGMFGCTSVFRLCVTPSRNYAIFFPVVYIMVVGGTHLSGLTTVYLAYYGNWRLMNMFVIALLIIHCGLVYFLMKPDHRPGPFLTLKGLDFLGFILWSAFLISGIWLFTFGEHYDWWMSDTTWIGTTLCGALFIAAYCRSKFREKPYLSLDIFAYRATWQLMILLMGVGILQVAPRLLQSIYLNQVLKYDSLNVISLNWPQLYGAVIGALIAFFSLVKWKWTLKQYFIFAVGLITCYEASMYFLIDGDTNREAFIIPLFVMGVSEVMIGSASNVYMSQSVPFSHFFFGLSAIGYIRCGIGSAASAAFVQRLYNWSFAKNNMESLSTLDGLIRPFDSLTWDETISVVSKQAIMLSVKECFGYLVLIGFSLIILIALSNYRTAVIRLLPKMVSIRIWLGGEKKGDPKGSVIQKKGNADKLFKDSFDKTNISTTI